MENVLLTCLVKDDFTNFILLYRKLAISDFDMIGINTAYHRKNQKFVLNQDITCSFRKIAYLGPTPIYEDFVTIANFPPNIDLNRYTNNIVNIDMLEHLKLRHIKDVFPKQLTQYIHPINVNKELFEETAPLINKDVLNIAINIYDPVYDNDFSLQYDLIYCLNKIEKEANRPIHIHIVGVVHSSKSSGIERMAQSTLEPFNFTIHSYLGKTLTEQIAVLLNSKLLISGGYGLGFLAYPLRVPSFIIYSFGLEYLRQRTTDPDRKTEWYIETTDEDVYSDVGKAVDLIKG